MRRRWQHVPPNRLQTSTTQHSLTARKTALLTVAVWKTLNLTHRNNIKFFACRFILTSIVDFLGYINCPISILKNVSKTGLCVSRGKKTSQLDPRSGDSDKLYRVGPFK
jgi:hypothetical protein